MNFNFYETSLNVQNGGAHSTNVKKIQLPIAYLIFHRFWTNLCQNSLFIKFFILKHNTF